MAGSRPTGRPGHRAPWSAPSERPRIAAYENGASLKCLNTIDGMIQDGDPQGLRLVKAAIAAFSVLEEFGFRIEEPRLSGGRGADIVARNDDVSISVTGDWYDRELFVDIKVSGAGWIPVDRLLPELSTATRRLPRNAKRGVLQKRLEDVVASLRLKAPEVLTGGSKALAGVLRAGAERDG